MEKKQQCRLIAMAYRLKFCNSISNEKANILYRSAPLDCVQCIGMRTCFVERAYTLHSIIDYMHAHNIESIAFYYVSLRAVHMKIPCFQP